MWTGLNREGKYTVGTRHVEVIMAILTVDCESSEGRNDVNLLGSF